MKRRVLSVAIFMAVSAFISNARAQFNTIIDKRSESYELIKKPNIVTHTIVKEIVTPIDTVPSCINNPVCHLASVFSKSPSKEPVRKKHLDIFKSYEGLPGLTISNLLAEIRKNGIKHEKVVLAQAILETGWFTSSVCRNKNNLFGLINPRTGQYYEFDHWTESVKAYFTKVQYRFKGGNYLLWLDEIGYAEKTTYIQSLMVLLNQYFI